MARFAKAAWHGPVPNITPSGMTKPIQGLVMHVMQGTMAGTDSWFHQSVSQVSAHFGNPKTGPLWQWIDTADEAWAEAAGNPHWISVEHEGDTGESLTASQIANDAELFAWLHTIYPIPLQLANNPNENGLGYHAMGGVPWGNHPSCPGAPIIAQRAEIVAAAIELVTPPKPPTPPATENDMGVIATSSGTIKGDWWCFSTRRLNISGTQLSALVKANTPKTVMTDAELEVWSPVLSWDQMS